MKILLINMPWGKVDFPSIQLAILKTFLKEHNYKTDISYQNLMFAKMVGVDRYSKLSINSRYSFLLDWLFNDFLDNDLSLSDIKKQKDEIKELIDVMNLSPFLTEQYNPTLLNVHDDTDIRINEEKLAELACNIKNDIVPQFIYNILNGINFAQYNVVGFTCSFNQTIPSIILSKLIKKNYPDKIIVMGGNAMSGDMGIEYMRAFPWIDYVVFGEGEIPLLNIMELNKKGVSNLPDYEVLHGTIFRGTDGQIIKQASIIQTELDETLIPDYEDYFKEIQNLEKPGEYLFKKEQLLFESARGCWWGEKNQCKFCSLNGESIGFRIKKSDQLLNELIELSNNYKKNNFVCVDNILKFPALNSFFDSIIKSKLDIELFWEVKPSLTKTELKKLAEAGVNKVQAGIENFSTEVLKLINKGTTKIRNIQFLKHCYECGIHVSYNYLFGFPDEKPDYYKELEFLYISLLHLTPPLYPPKPMVLQRFSAFYDNPDSHNIEKIEPLSQYNLIFQDVDIDIEKIATVFSFECKNLPNDFTYVNKITDVIKKWNIIHGGNNRPVFAHEYGHSFVKIYDNRNSDLKSYLLKGLIAEIYKYIETTKSFNMIFNFVKQVSVKKDFSVEQTENSLNQLISLKFIISEDDKYLSLSTSLKDTLMFIPKQTTNKILKARLFDEYLHIGDEIFSQHDNNKKKSTFGKFSCPPANEIEEVKITP